jgi:Na+-driven multidrug efflux pump
MMTMALGTFVITYFVSRYGTNAVAAYGAALRIEQVALIPTIGLNIALAAMVGQNNGAGRPDRVVQSYRTSLLFGLLIMVGVLTPVLLFARTIMRQFTESAEVITIGMSYLYIEALTFYSYVAIHQSGSVLQGLKRPGMILWASLYRQIPAPLLVFTLFTGPLAMGVRGIWWGLAVVNWSAALFLFWYTARQLRRCAAAATDESPAPAA